MQVNRPNGSGGTANPTVTTATLSGDYAVSQGAINSPGANMIAVTGLSCTITTTRTNEIVDLAFEGNVTGSAAGFDLIWGYQIDSGTPVVTGQIYNPLTSQPVYQMIINRQVTVTGAAGSYTLKIAVSKTTGSPTILGPTNYLAPLMTVTQR